MEGIPPLLRRAPHANAGHPGTRKAAKEARSTVGEFVEDQDEIATTGTGLQLSGLNVRPDVIVLRRAQGCDELDEASIRRHYTPPGTGLQLSTLSPQCGSFADLYSGTYLDSLIYLAIHSKHSHTAWLFLLCTIQ